MVLDWNKDLRVIEYVQCSRSEYAYSNSTLPILPLDHNIAKYTLIYFSGMLWVKYDLDLSWCDYGQKKYQESQESFSNPDPFISTDQ